MVKYMVALDGSDHSKKAFDITKQLVDKDNDVVVLVTVGSNDELLKPFADDLNSAGVSSCPCLEEGEGR